MKQIIKAFINKLTNFIIPNKKLKLNYFIIEINSIQLINKQEISNQTYLKK